MARVRAFAFAGVIALLGAGAGAPAEARVAPAPRVDIQPFAGLAPDGRSIGVQVLASCPERWTVVEAVVTVSQPQASGQASFPLTCIGSLRPFHIAVPTSGIFVLGDADITARVVIERGRTARADDAETLPVDPTVAVDIAATATLAGGGILIDVTVACPVGTTGVLSRLNVTQGQVSNNGTYTPVCDGSPQTFGVSVPGAYQPGIAQALTFADVEYDGRTFYGIDDGAVQITT